MSQSKTFALTVDPAVIAAKVAAMGGPKIDPTQATGTASADGITMAWDVTGGQIVVTIDKEPWYMPASAIWTHVEAVLGQPIA